MSRAFATKFLPLACVGGLISLLANSRTETASKTKANPKWSAMPPLKQVTALIPITGDRNFVRLRATRP